MIFDQTFVNTHAQTRRPWTVMLSVVLQTGLVAGLLIAPLLRIARLEPAPKIPVWMPVHKVDLTARPEVKTAPQSSRELRPAIFHEPVPVAPARVPPVIGMVSDAPEIATPVSGSSGGFVGNPFSELIGAMASPPTAPTVPRHEPQAQPTTGPAIPVAVGGDLQAAKLIFSPKPPYPTLARATRVQGTVRIQATISREGLIENLSLISGPPLLVKAALDAVRQWRYRATTLNGRVVEVVTQIAVTFTLSQ